jgi:uncharacterized protein (DUF885 family)
MKTYRSLIIIFLVLILTLSCAGGGPPKIENSSAGFDRFLSRLAGEYVALKPHLTASTGRLDHLGVDTPPPALPSFADRERLREFRWVEKSRQTLASFAAELLTPEQRLYRRIIDYWFADVLAGRDFFYHDYLIDHFFGIQVALPEFFDILPVGSREEARRYIALLAEVPAAVDDWLAACRVREKKGLVPPTIIIQQVTDQMRSIIYAPMEENLMYASFSQRLGGIDGLSGAQKDTFRAEAKRLITEEVYTAFKAAMAYLSDLKKTGKSVAVGLLELPRGAAYYRYLLKHYTTLELTPAEIHRLGLAEMERIEKEITALLAAMGREADIPAALANIGGEVFSGQEAVFAEYGSIIAAMEEALPSRFITLPQKKFVLARTPAFKEKVAGNFYYMSSLDDSRSGRFIMNLSYGHPKSFMLHLSCHETVPGHHLQLARAIENPAVPLLLKLLLYEETQFMGFIEGWALYAESLADELGFYDRPEYRLGYLAALLTRAARLVVDTGLHAEGWSMKDAERFYRERFGYARPRDVYRYMAIPGQGCAYVAGYLQILSLREAERERLGSEFDIREFHEALLGHGAVPLTLLEEIAGTGAR